MEGGTNEEEEVRGKEAGTDGAGAGAGAAGAAASAGGKELTGGGAGEDSGGSERGLDSGFEIIVEEEEVDGALMIDVDTTCKRPGNHTKLRNTGSLGRSGS